MDPGIKNQRWKIKALKEELLNNSLHTPFFVLTETHLKPYHVDAEVHIGGYTVIRADRTKRIRGGVAIYLHNSISADTVKVFSNSYCESVMVYNVDSNMVFIGVYRPPLAPFDKFNECLLHIGEFIDSITGVPEIYVAGDFNLPFIDWSTAAIPTGSSLLVSDRQSGLALLDFMETNFLQQLVCEPTRKDKNILDLIFSNNSDLIHSISVSKTEKSDHDIVMCTLLHPEFLLQQAKKPPYVPPTPLDDINFNSADWSSINA
jgi:hypothetical protein